jgi:hypothetical protein
MAGKRLATGRNNVSGISFSSCRLSLSQEMYSFTFVLIFFQNPYVPLGKLLARVFYSSGVCPVTLPLELERLTDKSFESMLQSYLELHK